MSSYLACRTPVSLLWCRDNITQYRRQYGTEKNSRQIPMALAGAEVVPHSRRDAAQPDRNTETSFIHRSRRGCYFVNGSSVVLPEIAITITRLQTGVFKGTPTCGTRNIYCNVMPGEAVKRDEYDKFYDPECFITNEIRVVPPVLANNHLDLNK